MRRLEIKLTRDARRTRGFGDSDDPVVVYATNDHDGGIFYRMLHDGSYYQERGNSQTPVFRTQQQFRNYLRRHFGVFGRTIHAYGWLDSDEEVIDR